MSLFTNLNSALRVLNKSTIERYIHTSSPLGKKCSGRYKGTLKRTRPLTYEMAYKPSDIAHKKSWNSWNTSNMVDGNRPMESALEDMFIRRFMIGTWHNIFISELIVKRHHNMVRVAGIIKRQIDPKKIYFLTGYSEELLSYYLHCPVKIELQSVENPESVIYKYI